ncbi:MAG: bifunctional DNA primase/polymerase [Jhaorihella sp.]
MQNSSHMARYGTRLVTNGYAILPIAPGTKKPGRFQRGAWVDYPEWNRHAARATTEVEVATWSAWPDCGVGLVGGAVAAIDIDIAEDAELALKIEKLARDRLGDTPALRIGRAPKRLLRREMVLSLCFNMHMTKTFGLSHPSRSAECEKMSHEDQKEGEGRIHLAGLQHGRKKIAAMSM